MLMCTGEHVRAAHSTGLHSTAVSASGTHTPRITSVDVAKVARLARLDLSSDHLQRMTDQLAGMLDHFADIDALELADVEPMTQPYPLVNVLRDDVVRSSLDRDEVLAAAPDAFDGRFRVPPVIGLDG
jgi:aspartyl-tRNA(Asn)/glutamyl-tRNA(Gln) amidotransferase subunit C